MYKKLLTISVFIFLICSATSATEPENHYQYKVWVMGVPQHLFNSAMLLEFEFALKKPNQWITLAPIVYYKGTSSDDFTFHVPFEKLAGGGLSIYHRRYLGEENKPLGFYLGYGGGYKILAYQQTGSLWDSYVQDGLTYFDYRTETINTMMHSANLRMFAGYKILLERHMAVDLFLGYGFSLSNYNFPENFYNNYTNDEMADPGYSGFMIVGGVKLGIGW